MPPESSRHSHLFAQRAISDSDPCRHAPASLTTLSVEPQQSSILTFRPEEEEGSSNDPDLVDWSTDDPERPLNWSTLAKCLNLGLVSFFRFLTPLASSMVAPMTSDILREFDTNNEMVGSFVVSIYVLGYALGPLVLAPLSELYGRLILYHVSNTLSTLWNLGAALSQSVGAVLVFRFFAGVAGSCPVTVGNGSIADCVTREQRGKVMMLFGKFPRFPQTEPLLTRSSYWAVDRACDGVGDTSLRRCC